MKEAQEQLMSIFFPEYSEPREQMKKGELKCVHYTSAEAAASIIKSEEIWLRSSQCMNDYSEIQHGLNCLISTYGSKDPRNRLKSLLEGAFPGSSGKLEMIFDSWIPHFQDGTYITCLSEHPVVENDYGRLSMWRAYGGNQSVAIVLNTKVFASETDVFCANVYPVSYLDSEGFTEVFFGLSERMEEQIDFISKLDEATIITFVFELFRSYAVGIKHPGFAEEKEWRIVYMPAYKQSKYVKSEIETINGLPQEVHKLPLKELPEEGLNGVSIPQLIDRIIIGPNDNHDQNILRKTFIKLLETAGCDDAYRKVYASGIPLRT